jgi:hypothetical protein
MLLIIKKERRKKERKRKKRTNKKERIMQVFKSSFFKLFKLEMNNTSSFDIEALRIDYGALRFALSFN